MEVRTPTHISQVELARRWGRSEASIALASAVGMGPQFLKLNGKIVYTQEEVQRFERACLFFEPADVAMRGIQ